MGADTFVGPTPPSRLSAWQCAGNTNQTTIDVSFDSDVPAGATVWVTARWYNRKAEPGPLAAPRCTNLPGGGLSAAA